MGLRGLCWPSYRFMACLCVVIATMALPAAAAASLDISIESWQSAIQRRVEYWCQVLSIPVSEWTVPIFCGTVLGVGIAVVLHIKDAFDYVTASRSARRRVVEEASNPFSAGDVSGMGRGELGSYYVVPSNEFDREVAAQ